MKPIRSTRRAGALLAAATVLLAATPLAAAPSAGAAPSRSARDDRVTVTVTSSAPTVPVPSKAPRPIRFDLTVVNTTAKPINNLRIVLERGNPLETQGQLDKVLANPQPPSSAVLPIPSTHPVAPIDLPVGATINTSFTTQTSTVFYVPGICLCRAAGIYPLYFSARTTGTNGVDQTLGVATTYLPSAFAPPPPVRVSWLWPLIDRPHRLSSDTVFTDDDLTSEVAEGGRLSRALAVVQQVENAGSTPLTLLIDPELLDELEVMAGGRYTVVSGTHSIAGAGQLEATSWLGRLGFVLTNDPAVQVELTPWADPDVQSLSQHGLAWSSTMPAAMTTRVSAALGARAADSTVAWPAGGAVSPDTLDTLAATGVSTVVLNSSAVTPHTDGNGVADGLARLSAHGQDVAAVLTAPAIEKYAARALAPTPGAAAALPPLLAELAARAIQEPAVPHAVLITAPRYVDPSVPAAVQAIEQSSSSTFTRPISLPSMVSGDLVPTGTARLAKLPASAATLSPQILSTASFVDTMVPALVSLLDPNDPTVRTLVSGLSVGLQRAESSAWHGLGVEAAGRDYARQLTARITAITSGAKLHIVRPSSGSYTLASSNSPLPITVDNDLNYAVEVRVSVVPVNQLPGFKAPPTGNERIEAHQKRTLHVATTIQRSGRIQVRAQLLTPDDVSLGRPVPLTVHSTALGVIGVVITIVAGVVLVLALLIRFYRRLRARQRRNGAPAAVRTDASASPA